MVVPALAVAKAVGKPVKLIYAREDDMQVDYTRPLTYQKVKVGLDAEGHAIATRARRHRRVADRETGILAFRDAGRGQKSGRRHL